MTTTGVVLGSRGGPGAFDEIEAYVTHASGGEADAEIIEAERLKYLGIGGSSPVQRVAERIASALERRLSGLKAAEVHQDETDMMGMFATPSTRAVEGVTVPVRVGMRFFEPSLSRAFQELATAGVDRVVFASICPFPTPSDLAAFRGALEWARGLGIFSEVVEVQLDPGYPRLVTVLGDACVAARSGLPDGLEVFTVFTAEGVSASEPGVAEYVERLEAAAVRVADRASLGEGARGPIDALGGLDAFGATADAAPWALAYSSTGIADPIGPSVADLVDAAAAADTKGLAVCPLNPTIDSMETLYDLDTVIGEQACEAEIEFARARVPNDEDDLLDTIESAVRPLL